MQKKINCFIRYNGDTVTQNTVDTLNSHELIDKVFVVSSKSQKIENAEILVCAQLHSSTIINKIAEKSAAAYSLLALNEGALTVGQFAPQRMLQVIENTGATMVYADYYEIKNGQTTPHPAIDYQQGSLRRLLLP